MREVMGGRMAKTARVWQGGIGYEVLETRCFSRGNDLEGLRIGDPARDAGVTKQAMGQMVKELERRGWVEVGPDPSDGRARRVCYTDEGLRLIRAAQQNVGELEREFQAVLGEESYGALRGGLSRLLQVLSK